MAEPAAPRWSSLWEADVSGRQHEELARLLRRCFPTWRAGFDGAASWASARPELRIVGRVDDRAVAHLAVLRRFLQVGGRALLVGDVGLVAVDPDRQGSGLGAELLDRAATALRALDMPFGLLTCGEQVAGCYATAAGCGSPIRSG